MSGTTVHDNAGVPLASIVIPTYNQSRYLGEAIQSALDQTYPNTEVIVVDNSSSDDTQSVIESFSGRIRSIRQDNLGPSSARNRGVQDAKGDFIVFLDGDDILRNDCAEARVEMLLNCKTAGLVVGSYMIVDEQRSPLWTGFLPNVGAQSIPIEVMLAEMYGPTCGMTVRKADYEAVGGFDESFRIAEDSDFVIRLTAHSGAINDPEVRAEYRQAGVSLSRNYLLLFDSYWRMARKNVGLLKNSEQYWSIVQPHLQDRLANLIFGKHFKERKLGAIPTFLSLFIRRPATISCFLYWVRRVVRNRLPGAPVHINHP